MNVLDYNDDIQLVLLENNLLCFTNLRNIMPFQVSCFLITFVNQSSNVQNFYHFMR